MRVPPVDLRASELHREQIAHVAEPVPGFFAGVDAGGERP